ncbi:40s ribosomal protein s15-4 [Quercus suber]|uniref:40s ribosomal protein s15-4 n=1 Tax=Quercus suber TaxID=58331 RepID=A0AAW0KF18_QUESU
MAAVGQSKKRTFKKFSFKGVDLDALIDIHIGTKRRPKLLREAAMGNFLQWAKAWRLLRLVEGEEGPSLLNTSFFAVLHTYTGGEIRVEGALLGKWGDPAVYINILEMKKLISCRTITPEDNTFLCSLPEVLSKAFSASKKIVDGS